MLPSIVSPFTNHLPVDIRFGDGVAGSLPAILAAHGVRRVAGLVDAGLEERSRHVAEVLGAVERSGLEVVRAVKPPGEPTIQMVDDASRALADSGATALVALGGGSVIDTAKAARLCAERGSTFSELLDRDPQYREPDTMLVAIPTTSGTGSEVSGGAVVTDPATHRKAGIAHPTLRAQYALVDPVLTWSMPRATTAHTGIDALAQAIAGMIASVRTPIGDAIALEAIRLLSGALVPAYRDGADAAARSQMACGSLMAGLTMNISDCTAEHSLGQAIGARFDAPHGLTVGLVLAETLERERRYVPAQLERVADAMGAPDDGSADGSRAVRAARGLLADLDFPVLRSLGATESDLDDLAEAAAGDFFHTRSPVPWTRAELRRALSDALAMTERKPAVPFAA